MNTTDYPKIYLYRRIVEAKLFIDAHFAENISVNDIAGEANFSKYHFLRQFKKAYGKTPHLYLTELKINRAKALLTQNIAVREVCFALGFESVTSFTKLFKKHAGCSPRDFTTQSCRQLSQIREMPLAFIPTCFASRLNIAILDK